MEDHPEPALAVSIRDLPTTHCVHLHFAAPQGSDQGAAIRAACDAIKEWVQ